MLAWISNGVVLQKGLHIMHALYRRFQWWDDSLDKIAETAICSEGNAALHPLKAVVCGALTPGPKAVSMVTSDKHAACGIKKALY